MTHAPFATVSFSLERSHLPATATAAVELSQPAANSERRLKLLARRLAGWRTNLREAWQAVAAVLSCRRRCSSQSFSQSGVCRLCQPEVVKSLADNSRASSTSSTQGWTLSQSVSQSACPSVRPSVWLVGWLVESEREACIIRARPKLQPAREEQEEGARETPLLSPAA